jgi:hypothetical protein
MRHNVTCVILLFISPSNPSPPLSCRSCNSQTCLSIRIQADANVQVCDDVLVSDSHRRQIQRANREVVDSNANYLEGVEEDESVKKERDKLLYYNNMGYVLDCWRCPCETTKGRMDPPWYLLYQGVVPGIPWRIHTCLYVWETERGKTVRR